MRISVVKNADGKAPQQSYGGLDNLIECLGLVNTVPVRGLNVRLKKREAKKKRARWEE